MSDSARSKIYPCGRLARRDFLHQLGGGFLGLALGGMWAEAGEIPNAIMGPHFPAKAKSVIFLFMCGGVSHIDTFDPKDNRWAGTLIDATGFGDNQAEMRRPVIPCLRTFRSYGQSGTPVSDWFRVAGFLVLGAGAGLLNLALFHAMSSGYQADAAGTVNKGGILYGLGCLAATLLVAGTFYAYTVPSILVFMALVPG